MKSLLNWIGCILLAVLAGNAAGYAQARPYVYGGASMSNAGYGWLAGVGGVGLNLENEYLTGFGEVWADNAHKTTDRSGYDWGFRVRPYFKLPKGFFAGAGYQWSEYVGSFTKGSGRATFGGGREWKRTRADATYIMPDSQNGLQGPEFRVIVELRHGFAWRQTVGVFAYHDQGSTKTQTAGFTEETLLWRF